MNQQLIPAKAGRFEIDDNGVLSAPAAYMKEQGDELLANILNGQDAIFNMTSHYSPTVEIAICVRLQTDYAGWVGMKQAEGWLEPKKNSNIDDELK